MILTRAHFAKISFAILIFLTYSSSIRPEVPVTDESVEFQTTDELLAEESVLDDQEIVGEEEEIVAPARIRRVNQIIIAGNKLTPSSAILKYVPYKVGEIFDPRKSRELIRNLYFGLKRFRNITVEVEPIGQNFVDVYVITEEKHIIKEVEFTGNKQLSNKELMKAIEISELPALDEEELKILAQKIKKQYVEKGYHLIQIDTRLDIDDDGKAIAIFSINEGPRSVVKEIQFVGNKHITSKELRSIMITKEEWVLSFLDKSGMYQDERIEADKHFLSRYYQNKGFLQAKVVDVQMKMDKQKRISLIYEIEEGERYTIGKVKVPGNELLEEKVLLANIPVQSGQLYSPDRISNTIKALERIWGNHGYIFAHIEPSIEPNEDTKTVDLAFYSELGNKIKLNKVNIKGNKKTRDKIIRRKISLEEGELITQRHMDISKHNVESIGYFESRDGVNWKITRIGNDLADLDLFVKEAKTGNFNVQMGFGGVDFNSPASGFSVKGNLSDTNLFGSGIQLNADASWAKGEQTAAFRLAQPWLFDKPISAAIDLYHRRPSYDNFRNVQRAVNAKLTGGAASAGWITRSTYQILHDTQVLFSVGVDSVKYEQPPIANVIIGTPPSITAILNAEYQCILNKEFNPGTFAWIANYLEQNTMNHPIHTSRGYMWRIANKIAFPTFDDSMGFYKFTAETHWFTPLINEYDLIFHLHAFAGIVHVFNNHTTPFAELFHVGGQNSVRGYLFGQIGPRFVGDSIGASRALFWNAELVFPITGDMTMKGVVFYDGGAGFNNPFVDQCVDRCRVPDYVTGNNFDYRHAVGVGVRLLQPMPLKVDWGFKIDPRKDESASEVHFGMNVDW
ncbi:MAG TPA: outer membrane protein assembly factor BamA [Candidatus Dependentiae bacterium]|nr:outer membrane protein assembly factor BamA [Candidatus Dependentiae bacterium]HRQ63221.1 outer membrane protein assembly factor BamA [Candidatus Dependentiae bacterium]